jgi:hypothetical protein
MWELPLLTTLWASTCYRDSFTSLKSMVWVKLSLSAIHQRQRHENVWENTASIFRVNKETNMCFPSVSIHIHSPQWQAEIATGTIYRIPSKGNGKVIQVTGREGPEGCETLRFPHFLDQRWPTGGPRAGSGPQLDLLRPPASHRFGSIGESFNICIILLVQRKI